VNEYNIVSSIPSCVWTNGVAINDRIDSMYYRSSSIKDYQKIKKFSKIRRVSNYFDVSKLSGFEYTDYFTEESLKSGTVIALTSQNVMENQINFDNIIKIPFEIHNSLERSKIYPNDILLSYTGQYRRACTAPQNIELHLGPNICRLRSTKLIDVHYVSTFLNCRYGQSSLDREKTMSAQPTVNMSRIRDILLPIPSSEIQKYIGDKVRKAEELREEAKRLIKEAEEILYSQLKQEQYLEKQKSIVNKYIWLSDKEVDTRIDSQYYKPNYILYKHLLNKNGIKTKKIKDVVKDIRTGTTPQSNYITKDEKRIKFLRVNNLGYCMLEKDDMLYVNDKYDEKKLKIIPKGDILVSIAGTLGRSSVVDMDNCTTNQNIAALTLKNINFIKPYYLSLYLNSYFGYLSLDTISTQATVKYINNELLGEIEIPLIDIDIQLIIEEKIARYKNKINKSKQLIQEAKQDVEDLIEGNFDMSKIKVNN
jgi:type I restriction enzyme S subunit